MKVKLSRMVDGKKCYWGSYDLSDLKEAKAFSDAIWMFGKNGTVVVVEEE